MKKLVSVLMTLLMVLSVLTPLTALADDEFVDGKFVETKSITVEIYDRNGETAAEDNVYTDYIKQGMLERYNIDVTFVPVPRWTEVDEMNNLLAANNAPDVSVTYSYPTILTYAEMGGVLDLAPLLEEYKDLLPDLWDLLGDTNIYWDQDPYEDTLWCVEAVLLNNRRINTFIRKDWLDALGLEIPTTTQEFEDVLYAFQANAETLLGEEADKMIPFATSYDVGWRCNHILTSFMPSTFTDEDAYIYGFDDRQMLYEGNKEAVRLLNKWYNDGLIWQDFPLYPAGDTTEDNLIKSGYVGAFQHNWDYPYRNGEDSIQYVLKDLVGEEAEFIAIEPFTNDEGVAVKLLSNPIDRKVFFPATNDEPLASLLYLNFIATLENRIYLAFGDEGMTYQLTEDGAYEGITESDVAYHINSWCNIDYTILNNGFQLETTELTAKTMALSYAAVDSSYIETALDVALSNGKIFKYYNFGTIESETGMGPVLDEKRNVLYSVAITASVEDFDAVYDAAMADYLASGGQAIIDERAAKMAEALGE